MAKAKKTTAKKTTKKTAKKPETLSEFITGKPSKGPKTINGMMNKMMTGDGRKKPKGFL
ncbi:hypothetical protein [Methanococcus voltae]|uniref:hypothetical protein n=1 Tax=Methanococcus voltae TaxID=2188 RepID=UPI001AE74565|nr:hypothetical protein [Methanococcus voltae]MBP2173073.1 hypothetical protein [Methanococcus voltae]